jgi:superfamily I DNA/RNA helicase
MPGDIAVLYPRRRPDAAVTTLCDRLNGFTRAVLPAGDKPTGTLRDEAVKVLPMHRARGLQFRIVLLLWADQLPSPFKSRDDGIDRGLPYVAMTRAGHLSELGIIAARGLLGLAELAAIVRDESDQRLPATARAALMILVRQIEALSAEIAALDTALCKENKASELGPPPRDDPLGRAGDRQCTQGPCHGR